MQMIIVSVQALACAFIAWYSLSILNKMTKQTAHLIRFAYVALAAGGVAGFVACFTSYAAWNCLFAVGVALFLIANQRGSRYANQS